MTKETPIADDIIVDADAAEPEEMEPGINDVSLDAWLADDADTKKVGKVRVSSGYLTVAAIMEDELELLQKACERPDPRRGRGAVKFDSTQFKRLLAAKGLAKANGGGNEGAILAALIRKPAGDVTTIAEAVTKVSGFSEQRLSETDRLLGFSD